MLEFLLTQKTQNSDTQSCGKSNTFMIIAIKKTNRGESNKSKNTIFENIKVF